MIYIYLDGYEYNLGIFELIRSFFPNKELKNIEDLKEYSSGSLIYISIIELNNFIVFRCQFFLDNELISKNEENLEKIFIERNRDKAINIGVKKSIYRTLVEVSKTKHPWGVLTGIRPTKIVHELVEKNINTNDIQNILINQFLLDESKANLIMEIAKRQEKYIYPISRLKYSLYINIPFCPTKCTYCSFPTVPIKNYYHLVDSYINQLIYEIKTIKELMLLKEINTVYIGGGTPTSLPVKDLQMIIKEVYNCFGEDSIGELTVEAGRPDTINLDMIKMFKEMNVNRISINPQSMNDKTLKLIGRNHTSRDILNSYEMAKYNGIETINMDLILGLPGEGVKEINNTLKYMEELSPENITVHTLSLKNGSALKDNMHKYNFEKQRIVENMLDAASAFADRNEYYPYYLYRQKNTIGNFENIGYSKKDKECIYNISIMEEKESIIGAGVGATTKIYYPDENRLERTINFRSINEYLNRFNEIISKKRNISLG
ncbi:MAG: coproporphyrinogen dehydrogenase HemZ [Tissierellia bacterium]|nr:coproporphyrinogen dehydrogenase HemZ [Tissierellia bacterium]